MKKREKEKNQLTKIDQKRRRKDELKAENAQLKVEIQKLKEKKKEKEGKKAALREEVENAILEEREILSLHRTKDQRLAEREEITEEVK